MKRHLSLFSLFAFPSLSLLHNKSSFAVKYTSTVGDKTSDKTKGLWPSDHAGVIAKLSLK
jgi:hypothetical protein